MQSVLCFVQFENNLTILCKERGGGNGWNEKQREIEDEIEEESSKRIPKTVKRKRRKNDQERNGNTCWDT